MQITEAGELAEVKCRKNSHCLLKDKGRISVGISRSMEQVQPFSHRKWAYKCRELSSVSYRIELKSSSIPKVIRKEQSFSTFFLAMLTIYQEITEGLHLIEQCGCEVESGYDFNIPNLCC